jgi:hypothetical protein
MGLSAAYPSILARYRPEPPGDGGVDESALLLILATRPQEFRDQLIFFFFFLR